MDYRQTLDYMYSKLPMFQRQGPAAYKKDLHNTLLLCELTGHPENKFNSIHIAGTNGKGSVSHFLASIMQSAGYKTGLYTSPHLLDFRERIKVNGEPVPETFVVDFIRKTQPFIEENGPSFFELTVVMAFEYFASQEVDIAIIETGLGGRLDSTNVITPLISVITNISYDHMNMLGNTLSLIAFEKAGIIKPDIAAVIGKHNKETDPVFINKAESTGSTLVFAEDKFKLQNYQLEDGCLSATYTSVPEGIVYNLKTPLAGLYQLENLATVLTSVKVVNQYLPINKEEVISGITNVLSNTGLRGRWEKLSEKPLVIADVAHNEAGIKTVINQTSTLPFNRLGIVFGMVKDKDSSKVLALLPESAEYYFCCPDLPRGLPAIELQEKASAFHLHGQAYPSVKAAFDEARKNSGPDDLILITGSFFVVAETLSAL